ncbi:MAG: aspartate aminotransferase [Candidatus Aminicenantes bacterium 4484_214]|nr:MAG: aspartate aminotransferase [Candidatus Aminicenantes bacterium 4484_214]
MEISKRGREIQASPIRKLKPLADQAQKKGIKVYFINIGQPDIPTPKPVWDAFCQAQEEVLSYGPAQGLPELREAIANYYRTKGHDLNSENIVVTIGGSEAIHFAFSAVSDPGGSIIIPEPYYTNYNGYASFANVNIIPLTLEVEKGFRLPSREKIESKITPETKAILLCSPNNPTGTVYTKEEIARVVEIVGQKDLFLIADEVYNEFIYDGLHHTSVLEFEEVKDRTIVIDSISKRFSCCGARIGAVITRNEEIYQAVLKFAQARLCPPTMEQKAALRAYQLGPEYFQSIRQEYQKRRDLLYQELSQIPGIIMHKPQGAFYIIVRLPIKNSEHFVRWMLTEFELDGETAMVAPAQGFYASPDKGRDEIRIAYVLKEEDLRRAIHVFREGLKKYQSIYS